MFKAQHRVQAREGRSCQSTPQAETAVGAATQAAFRDDGKNLAGQAERLQIKKPETWLRLNGPPTT